MNWIVLVRPQAEQDLAAARDWYEQKRVGLGDEFLDAATVALLTLKSTPERERLYFRNFRRIIFRRFPYKLFYLVIGQRVIVIRVLHA